MRRFLWRNIGDAVEFAKTGRQALVVAPDGWAVPNTAPGCFRQARRYGYLFDRNGARLRATAQKLGVKRVKIDEPMTERQHVNLCGRPLLRAVARSQA